MDDFCIVVVVVVVVVVAVVFQRPCRGIRYMYSVQVCLSFCLCAQE